MGFRVVRYPRAWWPVTFPGVAEDGSIVTNKFEVQFNLLKVDRAADFVMQVLEARQASGISGETLAALYAGLTSIVVNNWRGVEAENGDPLAYDGDKWLEAMKEAEAAKARGDEDVPSIPMPASGGENLRMLMNEPGLFMHIFDAFSDCIKAKAEIRAGN